jgi:hypothetical protein
LAILNTLFPFIVVTDTPNSIIQTHCATDLNTELFTTQSTLTQQSKTAQWRITASPIAWVIVLLTCALVQGIKINPVFHCTLVHKFAIWNFSKIID